MASWALLLHSESPEYIYIYILLSDQTARLYGPKLRGDCHESVPVTLRPRGEIRFCTNVSIYRAAIRPVLMYACET